MENKANKFVVNESFFKRIGFSRAKVENIIVNIEDYYYEKTEKKYNADGSVRKERIIHPSKWDLKALQSRLNQIIFRRFTYPSAMTGGISGRSNITNACRHLGTPERFVTDIQQFFPSINHHHVYRALISLGFVPDMARVLTRLTTYRGFLPQGAPTSSYIANIVMHDADAEIDAYCKEHDLFYSRYIDDITISGSGDLHTHGAAVIRIICQYGFSINRRKTHRKIGKADITGVCAYTNKLRPTDEQIARSKSHDLTERQRKGFASYFIAIENSNRTHCSG
ncbi:MAG TPA: reverse transcriptase family protein [Candidatus Kapabacteria bacterium]|nr:reverse transcriptase family protein [Candidatus Kapabacteria bacterium]